MTQDQLIILLLKVVLVADVLAVLAFIAEYSARAPWWHNEIGRTLVVKDILLVLLLLPSLLSLFLRFNRLTSHIAAWTDIGLFAALVPVMAWRIRVFERIHKRGDGTPQDKEPQDAPGA